MKNISSRGRENKKTHFTFINFFFFENRAVYELLWENIVEPGRPQMTIWHVRIACWILRASNTHSEYVICFSTATVAARIRFYVTFYVHCLSCWFFYFPKLYQLLKLNNIEREIVFCYYQTLKVSWYNNNKQKKNSFINMSYYSIVLHKTLIGGHLQKLCIKIIAGVWGWQVGRPPQAPLLRGPRASGLR
jgi:hypothetical protein